MRQFKIQMFYYGIKKIVFEKSWNIYIKYWLPAYPRKPLGVISSWVTSIYVIRRKQPPRALCGSSVVRHVKARDIFGWLINYPCQANWFFSVYFVWVFICIRNPYQGVLLNIYVDFLFRLRDQPIIYQAYPPSSVVFLISEGRGHD